MADYEARYDPLPEDKPALATPTYGDYFKTVAGSITGAGASLAAAGNAATEDSPHPELQAVSQLSKSLQGYLNHVTEQIGDSRTEDTKALAASAITSKAFLDHPGHWAALQLAGMTGPVAAMVFSGGPLGAAIVNGTLAAGSYRNDVDKFVAGMSPEELEQNDYYRGLRSMNMGEDEAREGLKTKLLGSKTMYNFLAGAAAGAIGPAGKIASGVAGKATVGLAGAETGVLGRAAAGAAEGGIGGGLQAGVADATLQNTEIEATPKKEFDQAALVNAVLGNVAIGGATGGVTGALVGGKGKAKAKQIKDTKDGVPAETPVAQEQGGGPNVPPVQAEVARASEAKPDSGSPAQVAPAKGQEVKSSAKAKTTDNVVEVAPVAGPDTAQAAALKPAEVIPPEVQAAAKEPELQTKAPEVAPITPEVTAKEPAETSVVPPTTPEPVAPTGRVLKDMSVEGRAKEKAAKEQAKKDLAAANAEAKAVGERKRGEAEKASIETRAKHAEEIVNAAPKETRELPTTPEARKAMAADLDKTLAAAAERGLVPRESLPKDTQKTDPHAFHLSIPQKVGDAGMSPHVRYLREVMDVKKALESNKFGPKSTARARVLDFINEHGDLEALAERRKVDGAAAKTVTQGDVEAPSGKVAEAMASDAHDSTMSPEAILEKRQEEAKAEADAAATLAAAKEGRVSDAEAAAAKEAEAEAAAREKFARQRAARKEAMKAKPKLAADKIEEIKKKAVESKAEEKPAEVKKVEVTTADKAKYETKQTPEERAAWLKAKAEKAAKAAEPKPKPETIDAALEKKVVTPTDKLTGEPIKIVKTQSAKEALAGLNLTHIAGIPRALAQFMQRRLAAMAGDTPVHIINKEEFARVTGKLEVAFQPDGEGVLGMHRLAQDGSESHILLRHDALRTPGDTAHVTMHEIAHAATQRALLENPHIHNHVMNMMAEVKEAVRGVANPEVHKAISYAMTNPREFIAEAFSNTRVQEILSRITITDKLAKELGLERAQRFSVWDAIVSVVRGIIEKHTGRLPDGHRAIEGVMRIGQMIGDENTRTTLRERAAGEHIPIKQHGLSDTLGHLDAEFSRQEVADTLVGKTTDLKGWTRRKLTRLKFASAIGDGRHAELSGPGLNKVVDAGARKNAYRDHVLAEEGGRELVARQAELERSHPEAFAEGNDLAFDASKYMVNPEPGAVNDFGVDATKYWQAKKELPALQKRFEALATKAPEVAKLMSDTAAFFKRIHDKIARDDIEGILKLTDANEPGLADRIFKDGVTDADKEKWGKDSAIVSALNDATSVKELKGWYIPFRRYGDWISTGKHELTVPENGTRVNDNTIQFYDGGKDASMRRAAEAYVNQNEHTPQGNKLVQSGVDKVYVDANNPSQLLDKSDINSKVAYRVRMETQHTEFHERESEARDNEKALIAAGLVKTDAHLREDPHRTSPGMDGALGTVLRSLEQNERYKSLGEDGQSALRQTLANASVRNMNSTSIKTTFAHRRNVAGMSRDITRVTADYGRMSANHLAQMKFGAEIADGFEEMRQQIKAMRGDKKTIQREEIYQEMHGRVYGRDALLADRTPIPIVRSLLQLSRSAKLAGVSFHVINSIETLTTSLPWIAGRHGPIATAKAIFEAYNTIGGLGAIKAGLKDTAKAYVNDNGFTDYVQMFKDNIAKSNAVGGTKSARLIGVLDYANERGLWGNDAIFEVGKSANPTGNIASRALDRIDLMANQVGSAVEGNNRGVTLLAAYNLEYKMNGGNHQAAMDYAYKTTVTTMGDYSHGNAPPIFNTRAGQFAFQFKKFAAKSYSMLGSSMAGTLRGDKESAKQFIGLMVTHAVVAGALGIPGLEPFKVALMASNAFGISGYDPGDFDNDVRQLAARVFGVKGGEMVSHGIFRGAGIEVSNRLGWDNLLTPPNGPKSNKPNDLKSFLWDTMAGAPAGLILDWAAASQALVKAGSGEDVAKNLSLAVQKASPIRAVSDLAKAYSGASDSKKSPTGVVQHAPLTAYQTGVRALGFTPSATAEDGAMRGAVASDTKKATEARTSLVNGWVNAKPSDKSSAWAAVQKWNAGQDKAARIEMKDLTNAAKRRTKSEADGTTINGIHVSKRTKPLYEAASQTYNP